MMPDISPITSKQIARVADLATIPLREVVSIVLEQVTFGGDCLQKNIIEKGDVFQNLLKPEMEMLVRKALLQLSGFRHAAVDNIEKYFHEVFGVTLNLTGLPFPEKEGFPVYMARPQDVDADFILERLTKHFGVGHYVRMSPSANIDRTSEQKRPKGLYVFAHVGGNEPDAKHLGKSYDDAIKEKISFVNTVEYLLITGFHMWKNNKWMDGTRTSSLWLAGNMVFGSFDSTYRKLRLDSVDRDRRTLGCGPRELFLG